MEHHRRPRDDNMDPRQQAQSRSQLQKMDADQIRNEGPPPTIMPELHRRYVSQPRNLYSHRSSRAHPYRTMYSNSPNTPNPRVASQFYSSQPYRRSSGPRNIQQALHRQQVLTDHLIQRAQTGYLATTPNRNPSPPSHMPSYRDYILENACRYEADLPALFPSSVGMYNFMLFMVPASYLFIKIS
ncbi:hypothetical protein BJ875DRAFT_16153 [Amylocarpus encephaloides]|uniref:Uncharacterized protein n=1 Tax=Amylocarpus encephaloides TaxID=45428 RepID=A0A9P7YJY2_9HELO|nr:hypothetical protein BJ875DRAFT_16153 [Amylocarpus encephaloides]